MAFRSANVTAHLVKFNSAVSCDFLDMYTNLWTKEIEDENMKPKHQTFAPSQMRCDRVSWFRLRGVQPDKVRNPDMAMDFTAQVGTACHETIQKRLSEHLGADWISVQSYVDDNPELFMDYDMDIVQKGFESLIELREPFPVRFACDGIIRFQDKIRLLEIKTAEFSSLNDLTAPKIKHIDQITCYATLLHIPDVLFLYQDRNYGEMKCFEITVSEAQQQNLKDRMTKVMELADACIAPDGLPTGDPDCSPSMCPYYEKCKSWGRF